MCTDVIFLEIRNVKMQEPHVFLQDNERNWLRSGPRGQFISFVALSKIYVMRQDEGDSILLALSWAPPFESSVGHVTDYRTYIVRLSCLLGALHRSFIGWWKGVISNVSIMHRHAWPGKFSKGRHSTFAKHEIAPYVQHGDAFETEGKKWKSSLSGCRLWNCGRDWGKTRAPGQLKPGGRLGR